MGDPRYQRTKGGKNWWRKLRWMPKVEGVVAYQQDGSVYEIRVDGWRKLRNKEGRNDILRSTATQGQ